MIILLTYSFFFSNYSLMIILFDLVFTHIGGAYTKKFYQLFLHSCKDVHNIKSLNRASYCYK